MSNKNSKKNVVPNASDVKKSISPEKKKLAIIISVVVCALLVALIPILIIVSNSDKGSEGKPGNSESGGEKSEIIEGTYVLESLAGSDTYVFKSDLTAVNTVSYFDSIKNEQVTEVTNYTYYLTKTSTDVYKLVLTDKESGEELVNTLYKSRQEETRYNCASEQCINKNLQGLDDAYMNDEGYCKTHTENKILPTVVVKEFIAFNDIENGLYEKK